MSGRTSGRWSTSSRTAATTAGASTKGSTPSGPAEGRRGLEDLQAAGGISPQPDQEKSGRRDDGKSITGGFVYRGKALPELVGVYVYGDYDTGRIWGLREQGGEAVVNDELIDRQTAENERRQLRRRCRGELYILAFDGKIYRLVPRS